MTYQTITQSTRDEVLQDRVTAAALKESYAGGPEFSQSSFGAQLQRNPQLALNYFMWPTAVEYESAYEYAVNSDNQNPGGDTGVITDANLQAVVQTHWPLDAVVVPQPEMFPPES
jgi:hypothetical protein